MSYKITNWLYISSTIVKEIEGNVVQMYSLNLQIQTIGTPPPPNQQQNKGKYY